MSDHIYKKIELTGSSEVSTDDAIKGAVIINAQQLALAVGEQGIRVNAAGRLGEADEGVRLMTTRDPEEALRLATKLNIMNDTRKRIEGGILAQELRGSLICGFCRGTTSPLYLLRNSARSNGM